MPIGTETRNVPQPDRRHARRRAQALLWRLALLALLLSPLAATAPAAAQEGSVLRLAGPVDGFSSLDPALAGNVSTTFILRQVYRGLMSYDDELRPRPELASEVDVSDDGLTYTFRLRDGVTFHDGRPVDAADVVYSLNRAVSPATAEGDLTQLSGPAFLSDIAGFAEVVEGAATELAGLTAPDQRTVRIALSEPRSTFLMKLAGTPASIVDSAQIERDASWWVRPNGSGPFRVERWTPGESLELSAFDGYVAGPPLVDEVYIRLGASALQSFNLYQTGQIDIDTLSLGAIDRALAEEGGYRDQVHEAPSFALGFIAFRTDHPPFDDPEIRRAVQLAFPRDKIASVALDGYVDAPAGLIPPGMLRRDWPAELPPFDLEEAREAIERSRYGSAERVPPITVDVSGYAGAIALRELLERDLGLTVEVVDHQWEEFAAGLRAGEYTAFELYWSADYPDPAGILASLFHSESPDNYTGYANAEVDALLDEAARTDRAEERAPLYERAQQLVLDDHVVIPLFMDRHYYVVRPGVTGVVLTPLGILRLETIAVER
jgi:ABC-type transport system substrate-binding protein